MPEIRIPLVGTFNTRGPYDSYQILTDNEKDQLFSNCVFSVPQNPVTQSAKVYCEKLRLANDFESDGEGTYICGMEIVATDFSSTNWVFSAFGDNNKIDLSTASKIFAWNSSIARTSMGITTGCVTNIVETIIGGVVTFLMTSNDGTGWFLAKDSVTSNNTTVNVGSTFTANTTSGSAVLASVSSFAGRYVGQALSGTGIAAGARILSMDVGASTITMTANATANGTGVTVTAERIAKIIDSDFPSGIIGPFACIDGFNLIMTATGIYSSNLNSVVSWTAGDFISTNFYPDNARGGVWVIGNRVAAFSAGSCEWFFNGGNPSGSPLSRSTELNFPIGAINSRCIVNIEGRVFFLSGLSSGSASMFTLNGSAPVEVPTTQLNSLMASSDNGQTVPIVLTACRLAGKLYVILGGSYVFDVELKLWSIWGYTSTANPLDSSIPMRASGAFGAGNYARTAGVVYAVNSSSPGINVLSSNTLFGNGVDIGGALKIRTSRLDMDTGNRKTVEYYELDSDVQASGTATLEVSDDDYATWTTIGTFDMTRLAPRIYRGGSFKGGRAHRLTHSADTPFRASTLTIKYGVGKH